MFNNIPIFFFGIFPNFAWGMPFIQTFMLQSLRGYKIITHNFPHSLHFYINLFHFSSWFENDPHPQTDLVSTETNEAFSFDGIVVEKLLELAPSTDDGIIVHFGAFAILPFSKTDGVANTIDPNPNMVWIKWTIEPTQQTEYGKNCTTFQGITCPIPPQPRRL